MGTILLLFLGALFAGTIFIPQVILMVYPAFGSFLNSIPVNIGGLTFSLIGFVFGSLLAFPILVWALKAERAKIPG